MSELPIIQGMPPQMQVSPQQLIQKLMQMQQYLQHLEQNIMMMSTELMATRAHVQMVQGMFVEQGMYTKEEIEEIYKKQVAEPIQQHMQELEQKRQKAIDAAQKPTQVAPPPEVKEEEEEESNSDVILPSEQHQVKKF